MTQITWISQIPNTPLDTLWVAVTETGLAAIAFCQSQADFTDWLTRHGRQPIVYDEERTSQACQQLREYLAGTRAAFDLPLDLSLMNAFQAQVLQATLAIPYGSTSTYSALAEQIGRPRAARAIGRAEATNPLPLVIPCHRVGGKDGNLRGYGSPKGIEHKAWLLELERQNRPTPSPDYPESEW
jgi:O-6-methylguanine DNA methyltransferase